MAIQLFKKAIRNTSNPKLNGLFLSDHDFKFAVVVVSPLRNSMFFRWVIHFFLFFYMFILSFLQISFLFFLIFLSVIACCSTHYVVRVHIVLRCDIIFHSCVLYFIFVMICTVHMCSVNSWSGIILKATYVLRHDCLNHQ